MYIPERFAHGFVVLSEEAIFNYKCSTLYDPSSDNGIIYNNPEINIIWPETEGEYIISDKDKVIKTNIDDILWN